MKKNKTDYWYGSLAAMIAVMAFIAGLDLAVAWLGIEAVARTLGLQ